MQPAPPRRLVAHLDMDAFYASVELLRYPDLRGQPVVIGGGRRHQPEVVTDPATGAVTRRYLRLRDYAGRGVATTATYEARAFGVHSGMGLMKAAALAPEAILLPIDFDEYRKYSRAFKAAVAELAPVIEDRGIDEIYIDFTDLPGAWETLGHDPFGGARALAQEIKNNVRRSTGLSCSIGLAPNKLLAKICSDLNKPDGLTVVTPQDLPELIWPLPVRRINGVGPKAAARLGDMNIRTIGELAALPRDTLVEQFGRSYGAWLHEASHGRDERAVVTHSEPVSMSHETTFDRDLHPRNDRGELNAIFGALCRAVAADLQRKGYAGRTIGIKLRFDDFRTVTRDHSIAEPTADEAQIRLAAAQCLKRVVMSRRLRLLGVRVGTLTKAVADAAHGAPTGAPTGAPAVARPAAAPAAPKHAVTAANDRRKRDKARRAGAANEPPMPETLPLFDSEPPAS
jgi:DNA polymerase-4